MAIKLRKFSTKVFSEPLSVNEILSQVNYHMPIEKGKLRIQDYRRSSSNGRVRKAIEDSIVIVKAVHGSPNTINSYCSPDAIYLLAILGDKIINPKQETFSGWTNLVKVDIANIDMNKCYADPEFDSCYNELFKIGCIPFIYADTELECKRFTKVNFDYDDDNGIIDLNRYPEYRTIVSESKNKKLINEIGLPSDFKSFKYDRDLDDGTFISDSKNWNKIKSIINKNSYGDKMRSHLAVFNNATKLVIILDKSLETKFDGELNSLSDIDVMKENNDSKTIKYTLGYKG